jgi:hypothetical protein
MLKINDANYETYNRVFKILWMFQAEAIGIDPDIECSPIKVLENWEKEGMSTAKKGLKEGLNDILTMCMDLPGEIQKKINEKLLDNQLPGFNDLIATIKEVPQKVIKRGKIKNLEEYYVIKEFVVNPNSSVSETDRELLNKIFEDFENINNK